MSLSAFIAIIHDHSWLVFDPPMLLNFDSDTDPDPTFHSDANLDPVSQNDADPDPASQNYADPYPVH
jgi:hypothetical protein